jgi:radical SAM superfamily enzyme YgiQ (UPF0313 family)
MKGLLITPCHSPELADSVFPTGLGYIASVAAVAGHDITVMDLDGDRRPPERIEPDLRAESPDIVGITGHATALPFVRDISATLKSLHRHTPVVLGGPLTAVSPEILLDNTRVDYLVPGEGERVFLALLEAIENENPVSDVPGLVHRSNGRIVTNPEMPPIENMDELPYPAWDLFPIEFYINSPGNFIIGDDIYEFLGKRSVRSMSVSTTCGCPFKCNFCWHCCQNLTIRFRSPGSIIAEIRELSERYDIDHIRFVDDLVHISPRRTQEFCCRIIESGLDVIWEG